MHLARGADDRVHLAQGFEQFPHAGWIGDIGARRAVAGDSDDLMARRQLRRHRSSDLAACADNDDLHALPPRPA
jgi:hypothetical protein